MESLPGGLIRVGTSFDPVQAQENKEIVDSELEALSMTLNENEMKVICEGGDALQELQLSRRPSRDDWKGKEIRAIHITIQPTSMSDLPMELIVNRGEGKGNVRYRTVMHPVLTLKIDLPPSYPSHSPPSLTIEGFYHKYYDKLWGILKEKWFPEQMVMYEWFDFCKNDFFQQIIDPQPCQVDDELIETIEVSMGEYYQYRDEEFSTLTYKMSIQPHTCDICYTEYQGSENFLTLPNCLHYFCKECVNQYMTDLIKRGEVNRVACPSLSGCKTPLSETHLRQVNLPEEMIEKFTNFSINTAIAGMAEFGWCPKASCGDLAELDRVKNFGVCTNCTFQFCLTCKEKYHFYKQCPALKVSREEAEGIVA
jgi:E3 ubiquitin-protein ligase RNF14